MQTAKSVLILAVLCLALCVGPASGQTVYDSHRVSGPYTHDNLDVFFFHSDDNGGHLKMLTLSEALEQDKVIVHETGNVGELAIENTSNIMIFIHGGDIVKGGRQDRMIAFDVIIYPHLGRLPLKSFCVEQGRWSGRGEEDVGGFTSSSNMVNSKRLKIASKANQSQGEVWDEVDNVQDMLGYAAESSVRDARSGSSLQLTLENKEVKARTQEYIASVTKQLERFDNVVGFAFAINGEINSADIYQGKDLFSKLWPKLIESCAIEAFSQLTVEVKASELTPDDISTWLKQAEKGKSNSRTINDYTTLRTVESEKDLTFETYGTEDRILIHQNILKR